MFQRGVRQRGVVLVVSLLMLMVLTMIGLAATRGTALEQRMTANQNDREVAFEGAEAALRYAEGTMSAAAQPTFTNNTAGAYYNSNTTSWATPSFWATPANVATYGGGILPAPITPPSYYIVETTYATPVGNNGNTCATCAQKEETVFYIYARGAGTSGTPANPNTTVILETAFTQ
jgi:type IV pilus assembly protein PilX